MSIETGEFINALDETNPTPSDRIGEAYKHIQLIKSTLKATFPTVSAPLSINSDRLNKAHEKLLLIESKIQLAQSKLDVLDNSKPNANDAKNRADLVAQQAMVPGTVLLMKNNVNLPSNYQLLNAQSHRFLNLPSGAPTVADIQQFYAVAKV